MKCRSYQNNHQKNYLLVRKKRFCIGSVSRVVVSFVFMNSFFWLEITLFCHHDSIFWSHKVGSSVRRGGEIWKARAKSGVEHPTWCRVLQPVVNPYNTRVQDHRHENTDAFHLCDALIILQQSHPHVAFRISSRPSFLFIYFFCCCSSRTFFLEASDHLSTTWSGAGISK